VPGGRLLAFQPGFFHRVPGPCVQIAKRRGCAWAGGFLWCVCSTGMAQATHAARINTGTHRQEAEKNEVTDGTKL